jgi:hypothetical protein
MVKAIIIGTILTDRIAITGLHVKVWWSKPGTGHDEKDDSLEVNN